MLLAAAWHLKQTSSPGRWVEHHQADATLARQQAVSLTGWVMPSCSGYAAGMPCSTFPFMLNLESVDGPVSDLGLNTSQLTLGGDATVMDSTMWPTILAASAIEQQAGPGKSSGSQAVAAGGAVDTAATAAGGAITTAGAEASIFTGSTATPASTASSAAAIRVAAELAGCSVTPATAAAGRSSTWHAMASCSGCWAVATAVPWAAAVAGLPAGAVLAMWSAGTAAPPGGAWPSAGALCLDVAALGTWTSWEEAGAGARARAGAGGSGEAAL